MDDSLWTMVCRGLTVVRLWQAAFLLRPSILPTQTLFLSSLHQGRVANFSRSRMPFSVC